MSRPSADVLATETAYLFRHVLLRDAAYQLQPPADRAGLHLLAIELIEAGLDADTQRLRPLAQELAGHALGAEGVHAAADLRARQRRYLETAVQYATPRGGLSGLVGMVQQFAGLADLSGTDHAWALTTLAQAACRAGQHARANDLFAAALPLARACGDGLTLLGTLREELLLREQLGEIDRALHIAAEAMAVAEKLNDQKQIADLLALQSKLLLVLRRLDEAEAANDRAARLFVAVGHSQGLAVCRGNRGNLSYERGRFADAAAHWRDALAEFQRLGDIVAAATATGNIGCVEFMLGNFQRAMPIFEQSLELSERCGSAALRFSALLNLAIARDAQGLGHEALRGFQACEGIALESGSPDELMFARMGTAGALRTMGDYARSLRAFSEAAELARRVSRPGSTQEALRGMMDAQHALALWQDVLRTHHDYTKLGEAADLPHLSGYAQCHAALALHALGRTQDAAAAAATARRNRGAAAGDSVEDASLGRLFARLDQLLPP